MDQIAGLELSRAVGREAALFENESDAAGFLGRVARVVLEHTGAGLCALYLAEPHGRRLTLRAAVHREASVPSRKAGPPQHLAFDAAGEVTQAFRERRIARLQTAGAEEPVLRLAVPIALGPARIGVLVLDYADRLAVTAEEEAALRGVAAQLAAVLQDAWALLEARESRAEGAGREQTRLIRGEGASPGLARGRALPYEASFEGVPEVPEPKADRPAALARFQEALRLTRRQVEELRGNTESQLSDVLSLIFSAHLLMLNDESFTGAMIALIQKGAGPAQAVRSVVNDYARLFSRMGEARLAEKAQDVRDLGYRLLRNLAGDGEDRVSDYRGQIAVARHVYPSDLVRLVAQRIEGLALLGGTLTAHVSILASSLSLPLLITQDPQVLEIASGTPLLLDATRGELHVEPGPALLARYGAPLEPHAAPAAPAAAAAAAPPRIGATADGVPVSVLANVNLYKDALAAARLGAEGIGLYRSEFPFIIRNDFLGEEEQLELYRRIVQAVPSGPVLLRTADIGGDKLMQGREEERNPFLGVRGIRFSLANRELFRDQLRAMLRAGVGRDLGIMLPMVSTLEEIEEAREELSACMWALAAEGLAHNPAPRLGAMVELPSAVMYIGELARATDFLSIGTNDLIMYLLAVDRTNERLGQLYRSHHPTVLRTIAQVAAGVGEKIGELSVCGDAASDPLMIPFLVGVGIRKLSVAPSRIEQVRANLGRLTLAGAQAVARHMLEIRRLRDMEAYLKELGECLRAEERGT